jgi:hypothetical protein
MLPEAIEQCAYCHTPQPVTYHTVGEQPDATITARVPICQECFQPAGR